MILYFIDMFQAKKISKDPNEIDDIDDDFSDDDISEEELNSFAQRKKNSDDLADTISMRSDDIDEDGHSAGDGTEKKKGSTFKNLMSTMNSVDIFKKQRKEKSKVDITSISRAFVPL